MSTTDSNHSYPIEMGKYTLFGPFSMPPHIPKDRKCYTMLIQSCKYAIFYAWKRPLPFSAMVHIAYQWKPCESYFPNNLTSFRSNSNSVPILGINKLTSQAFWVLLTNENWPAVFPTISLVQTVHVTKDGCVAGVNNCFQTIILANPRHRQFLNLIVNRVFSRNYRLILLWNEDA